MNKSIKITAESEEQMTLIKALMLSLDVPFKIEEDYVNENDMNSKLAYYENTCIYCDNL